MPFLIFVKINEISRIYIFLWNSAIAPVIPIFLGKFLGKQMFSQKQIFSRKSARISWHLNMFTKMVPLFQMLLTSLTFFKKIKKSTFLNFHTFVQLLQFMANKVSRKCENVNFRFSPGLEGSGCLYLASHCSRIYSQPVSIFIHVCNGAKPITDDVGGFGDIFISRQHAGIWRAPWGNELFKIPPL